MTYDNYGIKIIQLFPILIPLSGILVIVILLSIILRRTRTKKYCSQAKQRLNQYYSANEQYQLHSSILTQNELNFYRHLIPVALSKQLVICPKVRLEDIIEAKKGNGYQSARGRIKSRHIDFLLCDSATLKPVLALELDDSSHDRPDKIRRDNFVNEAITGAGLSILHTRTTADLNKKISEILSNKKATITTPRSFVRQKDG